MLLYRTLLVILSPVILIHLLWKALQCGQWLYFAQRLGIDHDGVEPGCIWLHCASVGEVKSILPLLDELHSRELAQRFIITSNTPTSREIVLKHAKQWIHHAYCPLDWRFSVDSFLQAARPTHCFLIETELWPNMIEMCSTAQIPVTILNGRLTEKTLHGQSWLLRTYRHVLRHVRAVYARNELDRSRYVQLGADEADTFVAGDLKLATQRNKKSHSQDITGREYFLFVSTHDDEEKQIAIACESFIKDTLFVIAPRHPERGSAVASQLHRLGLNIAMHSRLDIINNETQVYILDTIGELDRWYDDAIAVVVGGSFVNIGGHNIIEPLSFHKAVTYGPHMQNFSEVDDIVSAANAAVQVTDYGSLARQLAEWQSNKSLRMTMEQHAASLMQQFEVTIPRYADIILVQQQDTSAAHKP